MSFKSGTFATLAKKRHKREEEDENDENDENDANDAKRAATTTTKTKKTKKTKKRENGGALEWKDIVTNNVNADDPSQKPSSSVSNDDDNDDSEERGEKDTLDALMMKTGIVRAGTKKKNDDANANAMVKKKKNTEEDRARRKEAMHLKKELKNVNVKENNRNFERMFIGETIEVERMKTKENDAAHKNDDDDDDDDDNEGWYYPRDWTLKTRATFAKICSLDDDDDNDDAEDFDEDFDEEKARKISPSKSFSWVNDERGANAASAGAHDAFSTHGVNGNEPLSSKSCSFFYCLPSSSNSIVSSESNKNDSRRSAAMQRATISFQYPDSRLPLHAIDKMNISFNDNQMSSAATNAWFRKRSDQWTEALSSAYGRLRSYFSYSFYVAYEDRRIFFACPGLDGSSNRSSSSAAGGGSSSNFSAEQAKEEEDNNNNNSSINDDDDDECGSNSHSQGFAVITSTNQKLRDILTKNGIPFKPVFVTRDGKGFSVNDNQTKSDKMKNKKHLLFGGDANLFDVDDDGDDEKEEGEDNEKENEETGNRDHKKSNLQNSQDKDDGDGGEGGGGGGEDDDEDDDGDGDGYTNVTEKENDAVLKNAIHPTFIDAWNESKRKIKLKEEQEKNKVFERFNRDGAILVRGTLAVHGLVNVLLQFRGQDPGDAKVTEQTVMDSEALALAQMSRATTTGAPAAAHKAHQGVKGKDAVNKIHSDVGAILAPRPFANCFTKSFELRPNKVATTSETSKSKFMRLWTLDLGSNNTNNSDSYSKKKHKMMSSTSSDRGWCDPCDLIPPWTMARVCRVLSMEDDFFGSNDDRDDGDAMDDTIATTKNNKNNTVKQNILHENKNSIRLWLDTDVCSKVLNASVAAARLMSEESFSRRRTSAQKKNDGKKDDSLMLLPSSCIWLKPRDEAFGDEDEKRWAFSSSSSSNRHRENFGKKNKDVSQDVGIVQSLEFKKKKNKKNKNNNKTSAFDEEDGRASTDEKRTAIEVVCARSWK